jgi:hypothetical protein
LIETKVLNELKKNSTVAIKKRDVFQSAIEDALPQSKNLLVLQNASNRLSRWH